MVNYDGLYNKEYFGDRLNQNHFSDKILTFRVIENGTILPHRELKGTWNWGVGGIIDSKKNFIKSSFVHIGAGGQYWTSAEEVQAIPQDVIYLGMFFPVWGHCITDNLKFLWFFNSDTYKQKFRRLPIVYVPMSYGGGVEYIIFSNY